MEYFNLRPGFRQEVIKRHAKGIQGPRYKVVLGQAPARFSWAFKRTVQGDPLPPRGRVGLQATYPLAARAAAANRLVWRTLLAPARS